MANARLAIDRKTLQYILKTGFGLSFYIGGIILAAAPSTAQLTFDPNVAIAGLEPGEATLVGRPSASRRKLSDTNKTELVYSKNQVVYLLPFSPFIEAAIAENSNNIALLTLYIAPAQEYSARVLTDEQGYFTFRGLKPGRYLLLTSVPYKAAVTIREDTGKTRTETQYSGTQWIGPNGVQAFQLESSTSITSPVYRYRDAVSDLEHRIIKIVNVSGDGQTNLGDIQ